MSEDTNANAQAELATVFEFSGSDDSGAASESGEPTPAAEETKAPPATELAVGTAAVEEVKAETPPVEQPPVVKPVEISAASPVVKSPEVKTEPVVPAPAPVQPAAEPQPAPQLNIKEYEDRVVRGMTEHFAMTPQEAELVATEPEKALPGYFARCGLSLYYANVQAVASALPHMIRDSLNAVNVERDTLAEFHTKFPALKDPAIQPQVERIAAQYRAFNPRADKQQAMEEVGALAMQLLKLQPAPAPLVTAPVLTQPLPNFPPHNPAKPASTGNGLVPVENEWVKTFEPF